MWKTVSETQIDADSKKDVIRTDVIWIRYFECKHTFYILSRFMRIFSEKREKTTNKPNQFYNFHRIDTQAHMRLERKKPQTKRDFSQLAKYFMSCLLLPLIMCNASVANLYANEIREFLLFCCVQSTCTDTQHNAQLVICGATFFWSKYFQYVIHLSINSTYFNL